MQGCAQERPGLNFDLTGWRPYRDQVLCRIQRNKKIIQTFIYVGRLRRSRHEPAPLRGDAGSNLLHFQTKMGPIRGPFFIW